MKKSLLAIIVGTSLSGFATAGDYSDAVASQRNCDALGEIAASTYDTRKSPKARKEALVGTDPSPDDDDYRAHAKETLRRAQTYALNKAVSRKDAYMTAWGYCMDGSN